MGANTRHREVVLLRQGNYLSDDEKKERAAAFVAVVAVAVDVVVGGTGGDAVEMPEERDHRAEAYSRAHPNNMVRGAQKKKKLRDGGDYHTEEGGGADTAHSLQQRVCAQVSIVGPRTQKHYVPRSEPSECYQGFGFGSVRVLPSLWIAE